MTKTNYIPLLLAVMLATGISPLLAKEGRKKAKGSPNTVQIISNARLEINRMGAYKINNGDNLNDPRTNNAGLEFPLNSNLYACFKQSLWFACEYDGNPTDIRTAVNPNVTGTNQEYQPGRILRNAPTDPVVAGDPTLPEYRVYRIKRGDNELNSQDYRDWKSLCNQTPEQAPYKALKNFRGGDSIIFVSSPLNPAVVVEQKVPQLGADGLRIPDLLGDESLWCVYNDLRPGFYSVGKRNGLEVEQQMFAFASSGALGNVIFIKYKLTNKGEKPWKKILAAAWTDTDIGATGTDLTGCDSVASLAYTYNGNGDDVGGYGTKPPATGVDFFRGPRVKDANGNYIFLPNGRDSVLGASACVRFNNPSLGGPPEEEDPDQGQPGQVYNFLKGLSQLGNKLSGTNPGSGFMFPGNPELPSSLTNLTESELVAGSGGRAGDKRQMLVTGPFDMEVGESQEIICAVMCGQGSNNINSIAVLKSIDDVAQLAFDNNFQVFSPLAPKLSLTGNLDATGRRNQVVLNWNDVEPTSPTNSDTLEFLVQNEPTIPRLNELLQVTAPPQPTTYQFEGYNVYQYETESGGGQVLKIASFDVVNGYTRLYDNASDPDNPNATFISADGINNGIQRSLVLNTDPLTGRPFVAGRPYYFAVSTYYVNPYLLQFKPYEIDTLVGGSVIQFKRPGPAVVESFRPIRTVVVQPPLPGSTIRAVTGLSIPTLREPLGDSLVSITVVDPSKLTGDSYRVVPLNSQSWSLISPTRKNVAGQDSVFIASTRSLTPDVSGAPIVDGFQINVQNERGIKGTFADDNGAKYAPDAAGFFLKPVGPIGTNSGNFDLNPGRRLQYFYNQPLVLGKFNTAVNGNDGVGVIWHPTISLYDKNVSLRRDFFKAPLNATRDNYDSLNLYGATVHTGPVDPDTKKGIGSSLREGQLSRVFLVFTDSLNGTSTEGQFAYRYAHVRRLRNATTIRARLAANQSLSIAASNVPAPSIDTNAVLPAFNAFFPLAGNRYDGVFVDSVRVPFRAYRFDPTNPTVLPIQVNIGFMETNDSTSNFDGKWNPNNRTYGVEIANNVGGGEVLYIFNSAYGSGENRDIYINTSRERNIATRQDLYDIQYLLWGSSINGISAKQGDTLTITPTKSFRAVSEPGSPIQYEWSTADVKVEIGSPSVASSRGDISKITVFPNPYYGTQSNERLALERFVQFSHLPTRCTIRIYTLNGELVKAIEHNDPNSSLDRWDLRNKNSVDVASGMYLAYIDAPGIGTKILKIAIIQRQSRVDTF